MTDPETGRAFSWAVGLEGRIMVRSACLAILVVTLGPLPSLAQFGGMGTSREAAERWTVKVEMTGGRSVTGPVLLGSFVVDGDLGHYEIKPEKIKEVRFWDPGNRQPPLQVPFGGTQIQGSVITTSGEEIKGFVHFPNVTIETDFGTLTTTPASLRTLTLVARLESTSRRTEEQPPKEARKPGVGWEYRTHFGKPGQHDDEALNRMGLDGWELAAIAVDPGGQLRYVFKRPSRR